MDLMVRRDTVFRFAGKPTITCKAGSTLQRVPDWVAQTHAYRLGVGCGDLAPVIDKTTSVEQPAAVSADSTLDALAPSTVVAAETVDDTGDAQPAVKKRGNGKS